MSIIEEVSQAVREGGWDLTDKIDLGLQVSGGRKPGEVRVTCFGLNSAGLWEDTLAKQVGSYLSGRGFVVQPNSFNPILLYVTKNPVD